jgi:hypothetical protein
VRAHILCLLAACGFAPRTSSTGADAAPTPTDQGLDVLLHASDANVAWSPRSFMVQLLTEECDQAFTCKPQYPQGAQHSFDYEWGVDINDCVTTDDDYLALDKIEAAIVASTITFDPASAATCLAAPGIPTSCPALFANNYDWASSCYAALAGHVPDAGACTTDWECANLSSYCNNNGTCSP